MRRISRVELGGQWVAVHEGLRDRDEPPGDLGVTGDRSGAQQRLELPGQGPALVVRAVAVEGARERALLALGAQVRVDAEGLPVGCGRADGSHQTCRDPFGRVEVGRRAAVVDEEHVDVGCVRQLQAAEATHADHGERDRGLEGSQGGLHGGVGQVRELAPGRLDAGEPEHVARPDPQQMTALEPAQAGSPPVLVFAPVEGVERLVDEVVARAAPPVRASSSASTSRKSGWRCSARPRTRLAPSTWHARSAATGVSRNCRASTAERFGPSIIRRSWSRPRSGSGDDESQSRITGRSCCITRDRAGEPGGELPQGVSCADEVVEAERGESFLGGVEGRGAPRRRASPVVARRRAARGSCAPLPDESCALRRTARAPKRQRRRGTRRRGRAPCARNRRRAACASAARPAAGGGARRCRSHS